MRILLTGGTGFVGSSLAETLRDKNVVYCLVRNDAFKDNKVDGVNYVQGDLLEYEALKAAVAHIEPDVVVHLAACTPVRFSFGTPTVYAHANYIGTMNLVESIVGSSVNVQQLVYASTAEIYGPYSTPHTVAEDSMPMPDSPYSISKLAGEHYVRYLPRRGGHTHFTVLRPTNTHGRPFDLPEEARGYFVEKLVIGMIKGFVRFDGYPESTRKFLRVEDHVGAYLRVIGNPNAYDQVFNVAPEKPAVTLGEVTSIVRRLLGSNARVEWGYSPRPLDPNHLSIDGSKLMSTLGWKPNYDLVQGLTRTVEYWKEKLAEPST